MGLKYTLTVLATRSADPGYCQEGAFEPNFVKDSCFSVITQNWQI